jgi:UDP-hydrolysing UDP-N-acetyl-D-glucosamine 2-epimerase
MKILAVTSTRADGSPLMPIIRALGDNCVHYQTDGDIAEKLNEIKSDAVLLLGDMYRTMLHAATSANMCYPIIHVHGGEDTLGATDDAFRNAISKLSYYHFVSHNRYRERLLRMGEHPDRIFVYGAPGVDALSKMPLSKEECETELGKKFEGRIALCCYHPETLGDDEYNLMQLQGILKDYDTIIVSGCNNDRGNRRINQFWANYGDSIIYRTSFPSRLWLSLMRYADCLIGNSSSFIFEGMTLDRPIIIIGDRQKGRYEDAVEFFKQQEYPFGKPGEVALNIAKKILELKMPKYPRKEFYYSSI